MTSSQHVIWKNNRLRFVALICLSIFFSSLGKADASWYEFLGASGSLRPSYWNRDKSYSEQRDYLVGSAWFTLRPQEVSGFKFFLDSYVQGQDLARQNFSQGDVREAFIEKSVGPLDLKIGRQIIVWGRADKVNPTDSFSTKDLSLMMTDDEDQRKGQFATQGTYNFSGNFSGFRLISVWQSEWRAPKYPVALPAGTSLQDLTPDYSQNEFGVKLDRSGGETDWSISYFDGYNRTPDFKILSLGSVIQLGADYGRIQVYGFDFAKSISDYAVRGEAALIKTQDTNGANPLQQNSNIQAALGADRNFWENLNINAQVLYKSVLDFQEPASAALTARSLALQEATNSNQKYQEQFGLSLRPSYKAFNETLELELAVVSWLKNGDSLLKPKITYAISDKSKLVVGGEYYNGPSDTLFGQLKNTSSFFSELRYSF